MLSSTLGLILTLVFLSALLFLILSLTNQRARSTRQQDHPLWIKMFDLVHEAGYEYENAKIKQLSIYFLFVSALLGYMFAPIGALISCVAGIGLIYVLLTFKAKEMRLKSVQINDELCYAIARRMRSGESLVDALHSVQIQFSKSKLISHVNRYVENGYSIEKAIAKTTNDKDIVSNESEKMLCGTIALAHKMGGNSARIFERIGDCFHHTYELADDTKAALSQVKSSAIIISILPAAFLGISSAMGMGGVSFLFTQPIGWACLFFGLLLQVAGILWMKKLVDKGVGIWTS